MVFEMKKKHSLWHILSSNCKGKYNNIIKNARLYCRLYYRLYFILDSIQDYILDSIQDSILDSIPDCSIQDLI